MKVLIVGGAGYIGSRITPYLRDKKFDVHVVDDLWFGNYLPSNIPLEKKDLFTLTDRDLAGYDATIFIAGLSNDPMAEYSPALNFIHNAAGPAHLSYIAKKAGVKRFIYADSCSVYGFTGDVESTEESPAKSVYPYGISKLQGELAVLELADEDFSVICLRQGTVSGWSPRQRLDLVINAMYKTSVSENVIKVDNPDIWRPILAISDAEKVYEHALNASPEISGIFNASSGNFTVGEIGKSVAGRLSEQYGIKPHLEIGNQQNYRNYRVSTEKAKNVLGINFTGTIESIIDDLYKNLGTNIDFTDDRYYNIKMFKKILDGYQYGIHI